MNLKLITLCGIIGIWAKNNAGRHQMDHLPAALNSLSHRGPNHQSCKIYSNCGFGHARLSIIDTDPRSNQPFLSDDQRYCLVFNGELYNYLTLKEDLTAKGCVFKTNSDTEVLLALLILEGKAALNKLDGFFAFAFYDTEEDSILLARDRMGIKPLLIYQDEDKVLFSSELQAFSCFDIDKGISSQALGLYFGLTYIPSPFTIFNSAIKVNPGGFVLVNSMGVELGQYYDQNVLEKSDLNYGDAKDELRALIEQSVRNRMVSDVPLGAFLSGGLDSSIIAALAMQNDSRLKTFSVGFDHAYFNETDYASEVSQFIGSHHFEYILNKKDFQKNFSDFLQAVDEPFADSSAFAVYLLAKKTKQEISVALSGDGADELFGGYRKHYAEFQVRKTGSLKAGGIKLISGILSPLKSNRSDKFGELNRKLQKFQSGLSLAPEDRYWKWCEFIGEAERKKLFIHPNLRREKTLKKKNWENLNSILIADQELVLPNDMLKKVDSMSMAHALEVRTPFLDHKVVEFANSLPADFKLNGKGGKLILKEAFADLLPESVLKRSKKGFEIPIKEWLSDEIDEILNGRLFSKEYINEQGLFQHDYLVQLHKDWCKPDFADKIYLVWALVVFQNWWDRSIKTH